MPGPVRNYATLPALHSLPSKPASAASKMVFADITKGQRMSGPDIYRSFVWKVTAEL